MFFQSRTEILRLPGKNLRVPKYWGLWTHMLSTTRSLWRNIMYETSVKFPIRQPKPSFINPGSEELREWARHEERTTQFGAPSYVSRIRSRSAKFTKTTVDHEITADDLKAIEDLIASYDQWEWIQLDRWLGEDPRYRIHARLFIPKKYARIAFGWGELLIEAPADHEPDLLTINCPDWPERRVLVDPIQKVNYVMGTDYIGETKMSFLRLWMFVWKERGALAFHAGSKVVRVDNHPRLMLFFGLSGTGKTTLTNQSLGLPRGRTLLLQDDIVAWLQNGICLGSENRGLYVKTEGLTPENQPEVYAAVTSSRAILENVWVNEDGSVDFFNSELTSNGRAVIYLEDLPNSAPTIDMPRVDQIIFITRNPLMPAIARLTPEQAAVAFMLGESVETSAGDPTRAGQAVRVVGTNPFIVGPPAHEGNRFLDMLRKAPYVECFVVNTGYVGEGDRARKVKLEETVGILRAMVDDTITWHQDPVLGLEVPVEVPGVAIDELIPSGRYQPDELKEKLEQLRKDRRAWLDRFPGLYQDILDALY